MMRGAHLNGPAPRRVACKSEEGLICRRDVLKLLCQCKELFQRHEHCVDVSTQNRGIIRQPPLVNDWTGMVFSDYDNEVPARRIYPSEVVTSSVSYSNAVSLSGGT